MINESSKELVDVVISKNHFFETGVRLAWIVVEAFVAQVA